jgi:hypothetical protein
VASGDGALSVFDVAGDGAVLRSRFGTKSSFRFILPGERSALLAEELSGGVTRITWLDVSEERLRDHRNIDEAVTCCAQLDGKMYAFGTEDTVRIIWISEDGERHESAFRAPGVSCLDLTTDKDGILVATGHQDGTVAVTAVLTADQNGRIVPSKRHRVHSGTVTTISFGEDAQIISGGVDRAICVTPAPSTQHSAKEPQIRRLSLTLCCKNVRFAGVRTENEQHKLREWSLK